MGGTARKKRKTIVKKTQRKTASDCMPNENGDVHAINVTYKPHFIRFPIKDMIINTSDIGYNPSFRPEKINIAP